MLVIDRYTLLEQVQLLSPEQGGQVTVIVLTAHGGEKDRKRALSADFQKQISKLIEPEQLVSTIADLLSRKNVNRSIRSSRYRTQ